MKRVFNDTDLAAVQTRVWETNKSEFGFIGLHDGWDLSEGGGADLIRESHNRIEILPRHRRLHSWSKILILPDPTWEDENNFTFGCTGWITGIKGYVIQIDRPEEQEMPWIMAIGRIPYQTWDELLACLPQVIQRVAWEDREGRRQAKKTA